MDEETIFAAALELSSDQERRAYLDIACGDNRKLRSQIDELLAAHAAAGGFLDQPAAKLLPTAFTSLDSPSTSDASEDDELEYLEPCETPGRLGKLGPYEIIQVIGRGGMGDVFRAFDTRLHRVVAIKVLAHSLAANSTARKRFSREAQAAAAVSHDHVVTIHAVEESHRPPFLVMEFISGQSLQQKIDRQGTLGVKEILRIGMQMAAALSAAHRQGLVHRDIKPANILLENGVERVKITDFGLARAVDDVSMTQTGIVAGTPQYMAPEQARGDSVDYRADLFSLGGVLYAMCTGRPAFRADSTIAVLRRVCEDTPRAIRDTNQEIPDWLEAIINKLLAKNPDERFGSAAEVEKLLQSHLAHLQQPDLHASPASLAPPASSKFERGYSGWWTVAAALAIVLCGGFAFAEATGTTKIVASIIRVASGEGTLVIEVDDPNVGVTIDGEELVVTGAGPQEVRVKPGQHRLTTTKGGNRLQEHQVTITRGEREVVKVRHEATSPMANANPPAAIEVARVEKPAVDLSDWPKDSARPAIAPFDAAEARSLRQTWADKLGVGVDYANPIGMKFRLIPAGEFQMGSTADELTQLHDELKKSGAGSFERFVAGSSGPRHRARISRPYYLGQFEVTNGEYRQFVEATSYVGSAERNGSTRLDWLKFESADAKGREPVCGISWDDAVAFCAWLSERDKLTYSLPTEAQWEFACRAGSTTLFSFGDNADDLVDYGCFGLGSVKAPNLVGSKQANAFGLFDMHGNVDEWCRDWHLRDYYQRAPLVDPECQIDPKEKGSGRVARGGAWNSPAWWSRCSTRTYDIPSSPVHPKGFRVAIVGELPKAKQAEQPTADTSSQPEVEASTERVGF